jgi:thiol-disulfide isomerase/thioredoxin
MVYAIIRKKYEPIKPTTKYMQSQWIIYAVIASAAIYIGYRYMCSESAILAPKVRPNIVAYYASWCPASRAFLPTWNKVQDMVALQGLNIHMNSLNCDGADNPDAVKVDVPNSVTVEPATCHAYGVTGYPTIILYNGGSEVKFTGERTPERLLSFIKSNCGF